MPKTNVLNLGQLRNAPKLVEYATLTQFAKIMVIGQINVKIFLVKENVHNLGQLKYVQRLVDYAAIMVQFIN